MNADKLDSFDDVFDIALRKKEVSFFLFIEVMIMSVF